MRTIFFITTFLLTLSTPSYSQGSIWIKITPKRNNNDVGFDTYSKAAKQYNNRIESNYNEIQSLVNQTFELYEERIYKGCGNDFADYFNDKLTRTIEEVNRKGIDYSSASISSIKYAFSAIQREMSYYDCSRTITISESYNKPRDYSNKASGFPKTGMVLKTTNLWDSCDWKVMKNMGKLNYGDAITIHSVCETNIGKNLCFITLPSGRSAFVYTSDIEF